ncbi:helix-turn-helix domain-containing protein [Candidatus Nanosalina sp. VS9-1]|uniref:helix-turn-helix domain-containing protein n=1 Tax=Candidatus Nanosalina sp. VS9-1 TaxID=3388566 RepID=UPI0039DFB789
MSVLDLEGKDSDEIVFETFQLNDLQKEIFQELRNDQLTVKQIGNQVERSRSTVQRALQEMLEKDLILREGKTEKTVYYVYTTLPWEDIKELTRQTISEWYEEVDEKLS